MKFIRCFMGLLMLTIAYGEEGPCNVRGTKQHDEGSNACFLEFVDGKFGRFQNLFREINTD